MESINTTCPEIYDIILGISRSGNTHEQFLVEVQEACINHENAHGCGGETEPAAPSEPLTLDKANDIVGNYLVERGYNGREVRIHKRFTFFDDEAPSQPFEINWSACGAQSLEDAAAFANAVLIAKTLAETLLVNGEAKQ